MCLLALYERAKSRNDWCFRLRLYEYFLCQAFQFRERLDATTTFCNVAHRFTLRSLTLFRVCSCVCQFFEVYYYHNNLTQTIFEMTQFKMSRGTFDPLSIISRLNTAPDSAIHLLNNWAQELLGAA